MTPGRGKVPRPGRTVKTMRCVDVVRELAVPTGEPGSAELAEHLATCPRCAAEAGNAARLDRLWVAARPPDPSPAQWETLWASVSRALDRPPAFARAAPLRAAGGRSTHRTGLGRRWVLPAIGLAQAAAVLIAVLVVSQRDRREPGPIPAPRTVAVAIDEGQHVVIIADRQGIHVRDLPDEGTNAFDVADPYFLILNAFEGMDNPVIALRD